MGRGGLGLSVSESSESATTPFFEVDSFVYFDLSFLYYSENAGSNISPGDSGPSSRICKNANSPLIPNSCYPASIER